MQKIITLISLTLLISCNTPVEPTFTLYGNIQNSESEYLILSQIEDIEKKVSKIIDTIYFDKKGDFKAEYNEEPHLYSLRFNNKKSARLAIDQGQNIKIEYTDAEIVVTGSVDTDLLKGYELIRKESLNRLVNKVRRKISIERKKEQPNSQHIDSLSQLEIANYNIHLDELTEYIDKNLATSIGIYATSLRWKGGQNLAKFKSIVDRFILAHPNTQISQKVKEKLIRLEKTSIGAIIPSISIPDQDGVQRALINSDKRYILIDFWACWCIPCRSESRVLTNLYKGLNSLGFDIYSVSLDTNKERWLKAIVDDNRTWSNVNSFDGFKTDAAHQLAVTALPNNYLVDDSGKIIAKDVHGDELKSLINKLFKAQ